MSEMLHEASGHARSGPSVIAADEGHAGHRHAPPDRPGRRPRWGARLFLAASLDRLLLALLLIAVLWLAVVWAIG